MTPEQQPITGAEYRGTASTPSQALAQFYAAFNAASLDELANSWEQSDDIVMDNPIGGIVRGWAAVRQVYSRLVNGPAKISVEFYDYTLHEMGDMFYAVGRERGAVRVAGRELALAIRTTRVFRRRDGIWRQVHHHGSMDDPAMLAEYQRLVLGGEAR
jgi:ketosteroid isomerase-like protein